MNIPTKIDDIMDTPAHELIDLPAKSLALIMEDIQSLKEKAESAKIFLESILGEKYKDRVLKELSGKDEPFGTVHVIDDDIDVSITTPKKMSWCDQSLSAISTVLTDQWKEDPDEYINVKRSVSEAKYKAWPKTIQKLFEPARTVMPGKTSYKFEGIENNGN